MNPEMWEYTIFIGFHKIMYLTLVLLKQVVIALFFDNVGIFFLSLGRCYDTDTEGHRQVPVRKEFYFGRSLYHAIHFD